MPDGVCVMTLLAAVHSEAGTFHSLAAAWISITRAVAPPLRTYSCEVRMPRLPPVEKSPHARLRATLWPGVGYSVVTFDQSHSSSSATSWARPVSEPWPISERAMRITTVSSGRITTQALTSGEPSAARTTVGAAEGNIEAERKAGADGGGADHEGAAIESVAMTCLFMAVLPQAFAAAWIASRTCWKVPQRQILVMASSMSGSVGFGFSFSSAATAMIMPLWQ